MGRTAVRRGSGAPTIWCPDIVKKSACVSQPGLAGSLTIKVVLYENKN
jgi:hypothetical protein